MRFKCNRNCFCSRRARARNDLAKDVGVGPMNAVEIPNADQRRSVVVRNIFEFVKDLHYESTAEIAECAERSQKEFKH